MGKYRWDNLPAGVRGAVSQVIAAGKPAPSAGGLPATTGPFKAFKYIIPGGVDIPSKTEVDVGGVPFLSPAVPVAAAMCIMTRLVSNGPEVSLMARIYAHGATRNRPEDVPPGPYSGELAEVPVYRASLGNSPNLHIPLFGGGHGLFDVSAYDPTGSVEQGYDDYVVGEMRGLDMGFYNPTDDQITTPDITFGALIILGDV